MRSDAPKIRVTLSEGRWGARETGNGHNPKGEGKPIPLRHARSRTRSAHAVGGLTRAKRSNCLMTPAAQTPPAAMLRISTPLRSAQGDTFGVGRLRTLASLREGGAERM